MDMTNSCSEGIESWPRFVFVVDGPLIPRFFLLLQQGVMIRSRIGCSVGSFLREEIGATKGTIEKIQSVILDGRPVDDIESALIKDGSILAFSAALPGLVGATLRRGGTYSSFRSTITYHEIGEENASGEGFVQIKLFNLLMGELGPALLQKGVILSYVNFFSFASEQPPDFWERCRQITFNSRLVNCQELMHTSGLSEKDRVSLSVTSA